MSEVEIAKLDIACEYLNAAIEFFLAGTNYFSAIHLCAAAEELLGAHLPKDKRIFTLARNCEKAMMSETREKISDSDARNNINEWKNGLKHMDDITTRTIQIDPAFAANWHIELALNNFYKLELPKSASVWKFEDHQSREIQAGA